MQQTSAVLLRPILPRVQASAPEQPGTVPHPEFAARSKKAVPFQTWFQNLVPDLVPEYRYWPSNMAANMAGALLLPAKMLQLRRCAVVLCHGGAVRGTPCTGFA